MDRLLKVKRTGGYSCAASAARADPDGSFRWVIEGMEAADAWYSGYGERAGGGIRAGRQDPVFFDGNEDLRREFPRLDYIRRAEIIH